ncbi:MAG: hydrogen gas-evolving membrane-bound hydrogenase subunit E [Verrucomicrobiota bacterium]
MKIIGGLAVIVTGALLLRASHDFPDWGDPLSPANDSQTSNYFLENAYVDAKTPNVVTVVLGDYRAFDTMFETVVILTAGLAIFAVLGWTQREDIKDAAVLKAVEENPIIGVTCRLLVPVIQVFALYVLAHGHYSPGGGFQGGVMFGASFIILALGTGLGSALKRFRDTRALVVGAIGVLVYAGIGFLPMFLGDDPGRNFLDYGALKEILPVEKESMARSHAILGIETGVFITVSAVMFAVYFLLASHGRTKDSL